MNIQSKTTVFVPSSDGIMLWKIAQEEGDVPSGIPELKNKIASEERPLPEPLKHSNRVLLRYEQLEKAQFESVPLTSQERLKLAIYIEETLLKIENVGQRILLPASHECGPPRDIVIVSNKTLPNDNHDVNQTAKQRIFILSDPKKSLLKAKGDSKKIFSGIELPLKRKDPYAPTVCAHIYSKNKRHANTNRQELEIFKKLRGLPGIVKMHTCYDVAPLSKDTAPTFGAIFEPYEKELRELDIENLSTGKRKHIARQILSALDTMHNKDIVHGDIKSENILIKKIQDPVDGFTVGLTDFGFSFIIDPNNPQKAPITSIFNWGIYGTPFATPPELLHSPGFSGDFKKLDVWAAGIVLYELFTNDEIAWDGHIIDRNDKPSKEEFRTTIEEYVETPLKKLTTKANELATQSDQIHILIYNMLRYDPEKRFTCSQALKALEAIG